MDAGCEILPLWKPAEFCRPWLLQYEAMAKEAGQPYQNDCPDQTSMESYAPTHMRQKSKCKRAPCLWARMFPATTKFWDVSPSGCQNVRLDLATHMSLNDEQTGAK